MTVSVLGGCWPRSCPGVLNVVGFGDLGSDTAWDISLTKPFCRTALSLEISAVGVGIAICKE